MTAEKDRLDAARTKVQPWKKWGPYLSERQWGTVREDYSENGDAWDYFTHDQSRSRAYRWGEDGLAGISDDHQILCFALALWNGKDPILKERLFGLTNSEGNHGEDVKEYYFYLDSTPTHSYMKYLYKYPHAAYPYRDLIETNRQRGRAGLEYELLDTGIFNEDRYFDVFVEYAKDGPEDLHIKISVANRGPEAASLQLLPTLWFRNTWTWSESGPKPTLKGRQEANYSVISAHSTDPLFQESLGDYSLYCDEAVTLLFTENETNNARLFNGQNSSPYVKDGINDFVVDGHIQAVNPASEGTKACPHYNLNIGAGETRVIRLRLLRPVSELSGDPFQDFDNVFAARTREADEFYESITPPPIRDNADRKLVMRQALAGMLWSKQYFYYDLKVWLNEHNAGPLSTPEMRKKVRNGEWAHMFNDDIISMPDKWEYPWYAAWDLAFHMLAFQVVDPDFAKSQLDLILRNDYLHPNGQMPAYEWNFGDVNPPVHAYATMQIYLTDKERNNGVGDLEFLVYAFSKLLANFTWWINRKDRSGNNVFEGGFLGLDNIGVFDRSSELPTGGYLEQADGTRVDGLLQPADAAYLGRTRSALQDFRRVCREVLRAHHVDCRSNGPDGCEPGQDVGRRRWIFLRCASFADGEATRLKVRSMVGLLPLTAVAIFEEDLLEKMPAVQKRIADFLERHPELAANVHMPSTPGLAGRRMLSTVNEEKLRRILSRMLDENEFLGPHGNPRVIALPPRPSLRS